MTDRVRSCVWVDVGLESRLSVALGVTACDAVRDWVTEAACDALGVTVSVGERDGVDEGVAVPDITREAVVDGVEDCV